MKMKIPVLVTFVLLFAVSSLAQEAMPTKEETVNYIQKKLLETEGRPACEKCGPEQRWSFKLVDGKVTMSTPYYTVGSGGGGTYGRLYEFDPKHISDVKIESYPHLLMDGIRIDFPSDLAMYYSVDQWGTADRKRGDRKKTIYFPCLRVAGNADRIRKAILHLRDLAKSEDELF